MADGSKEKFESYLDQNQDNIGSAIHYLWASKDAQQWRADPYYYIRLGSLADKIGQVMFAQDVLEEALDCFPGNPRLVQLYGLSSLKCGYLLKARDLLMGLIKKGHQDEETLGILGSVYKEMWMISDRSNTAHPYLMRSRNLYLKAFEKNRGYYSGINAASLSLLAGDGGSAERLARQVLKICSGHMKAEGAPDYWLYATVGEACALLGKGKESLAYYRHAKKQVGRNFNDLASMRRQLKLLSAVTPIAQQLLEELRVPPVVAFTGHMIDSPSSRRNRFPAELAGAVGRQIGEALAEVNGHIGYSSAACGSDVLFLEELQNRGGESNIILPFDREDFYAASVDFAGEEWRKRVDGVLRGGTRVEEVTIGKYEGDDVLFAYANQIIMGKAILRSRFLETEPILIAVWDGNSSKGAGGTADFIRTWERTGYPVKIVDLRAVAQASNPSPRRPRRARISSGRRRRSVTKRETVAMLFADLVGFSQLAEEQMPSFIEGFLGSVAERLAKLKVQPVYRNSWGDALYFVFTDCVSAAECALALRDLMREVEWAKLGLPKNLTMRIGLHAGPAFHAREPLLNRDNYFGYHVNQAARIEPITTPGNVYASEQFASLLMGARAEHLDCRYVGVIVLPKNFGSYRIYHIKRKHEIE